MKNPHSGGAGVQLQGTEPWIAPGKGSGFQFECGACEGAAEIILGIRVAAWKTRTTGAQNGRDLCSGTSAPQQFLGDPLVGNAPIRLGEAFGNAQPVQPIGIDAGGCRCRMGGSEGSGPVRARGRNWLGRTQSTGVDRLDQYGTSRRQLRVSIQHSDPRSVTALVAPLRLLVDETGQAAQMAPIGAGQIPTVVLRASEHQ